MLVHTAPAATVDPVDDRPPPLTGRAAGSGGPVSRRALLGLLAAGGAGAGSLHLTGRLVADFDSPNRLDPASALTLTVTGVTSGLDPVAGDGGHGGHGAAGASDAPPDAQVWSRVLTVDLLITNRAATDVLFSPGQVRLRLRDGTGVMPVESARAAGPLRAGTSAETWVRFLAPGTADEPSIDYLPAGSVAPLPLAVGAPHLHRSAR